MSYCVCTPYGDDEMVKNFIRVAASNPGQISLDTLRDPQFLEQLKGLDIFEIRQRINTLVPFRLPHQNKRQSACPNGKTQCCGTCHHYCKYRCMMDIYTRIAIFYNSNVDSVAMRMVRLLAEDSEATPVQLSEAISDIISARSNPKLQELS